MSTGARRDHSLKEAVQAAIEAMLDGRLDEASVLLYRHASGLITRRLVTGDGVEVAGMSDEDAADNLYPTILRFVKSRPDGRAGGINWLYRVIRSQALDFHRKRLALKRGGDLAFEPLYGEDGEVHPDVDQAGSVFDGEAAGDEGLEDCMEQALAEFEKDAPAYARVLRLVKEGLDNDELAVAYGARPEAITDAQRRNIRQRKSHALKMAREYFEPCKD